MAENTAQNTGSTGEYIPGRGAPAQSGADALRTAAPDTLRASLGDLSSVEPWKKKMYSLHRLGKDAVRGDLAEVGANAFDKLFEKLAAGDPSLGGGDFANANSVYSKMKIQSPTELFFVDGKPLREYAGAKYPGMKEADLDRALKAEAMAAVVSGRHYVEMARVQMGEEGGLQIGVSQVNMDLTFLDDQTGFLRSRPSDLAATLKQEDKGKESRREAVRESFGSRVSGLLAAELRRKELLDTLDAESAKNTADLSAFAGSGPEGPSAEDFSKAARAIRLDSAGRESSVRCDINVWMLAQGRSFSEILTLSEGERKNAGKGFVQFCSENALTEDLEAAENRPKLRKIGELWRAAADRIMECGLPRVDLKNPASALAGAMEAEALSTFLRDFSRNTETLRGTQAFKDGYGPADQGERFQLAGWYADRVEKCVRDQGKDLADMRQHEFMSAVCDRLALDAYGGLFQGKKFSGLSQGREAREQFDILADVSAKLAEKLESALRENPGLQQECTAYLREGGKPPKGLNLQEAEKEVYRTRSKTWEEKTSLMQRAREEERKKTGYTQQMAAKEKKALQAGPKSRDGASSQRGGAGKSQPDRHTGGPSRS